MNYPAASYGVSKTPRNEASFGEYYHERLNRYINKLINRYRNLLAHGETMKIIDFQTYENWCKFNLGSSRLQNWIIMGMNPLLCPVKSKAWFSIVCALYKGK